MSSPSTWTDPLRSGAIFKLASPGQVRPPKQEDVMVSALQKAFDVVYRSTPLPAFLSNQPLPFSPHAHVFPPQSPPASAVRSFGSVTSSYGSVFPMSPPLMPPPVSSPSYNHSTVIQETTSTKSQNRDHLSATQEPTPASTIRSSSSENISIKPRSQSVPPSRTSGAAPAPAPVTTIAPAASEAPKVRSVSASRSRVTTGGDSGLTGMFSDILGSSSSSSSAAIRQKSSANSSSSSSSSGANPAVSRHTARTTSASGSSSIVTNALISSPLVRSSSSSSSNTASSSSGAGVSNGISMKFTNSLVNGTTAASVSRSNPGNAGGVVIHSPPVRSKSPFPATSSGGVSVPGSGAASVSERSSSLQQHIQFINSRRSTEHPSIASAVPAPAVEEPPAPHTVTRSGRQVSAPDRMRPQEHPRLAASIDKPSYSSSYRASPATARRTPQPQSQLQQQQNMVAVSVVEDGRTQFLSRLVYLEVNKMKDDGIVWFEICQNVNKQLKDGSRVTVDECKNIYDTVGDNISIMKCV